MLEHCGKNEENNTALEYHIPIKILKQKRDIFITTAFTINTGTPQLHIGFVLEFAQVYFSTCWCV